MSDRMKCGVCGLDFDPADLDQVRFHAVDHQPVEPTGIRGVRVDEIEPALTPEEWSGEDRLVLSTTSHKLGICLVLDRTPDGLRIEHHSTDMAVTLTDEDSVQLVAFANAALPDGHPQKLTWAMVDALGDCLGSSEEAGVIAALADRTIEMLKSLLPPREAKS